jgi:uncharacterized peroxidase-related enzyme
VGFTSYVPEGAGIGAVYAADRRVWDPFLEFTHALMRGPSPLSVAERELIAAYVSRLCECDYCAGAHGATAARLGFPATVLHALVDDLDTAPVSDALRELLRFVQLLTLTPTRVTGEDVAAVGAAGWGELALNHAIGIATRYVMATRISHAHGIVVSPAKLEEAGRIMADPDWTCLPANRRVG